MVILKNHQIMLTISTNLKKKKPNQDIIVNLNTNTNTNITRFPLL